MLNGFYIRQLLLILLATGLSGCLGGTVAQQLARSIATSVADKAVAKAMDVDEDSPSTNSTYGEPEQSSLAQNPMAAKPTEKSPQGLPDLQNQMPKIPSIEALAAKSRMPSQEEMDEFNEKYILASSGFKTVEQLESEQAHAELPVTKAATPTPKEPEILPEARPLVRVEVLNLLAADEKQAVYEKARLLGALNLPQAREWKLWQVATGRAENSQELITFLIPPQFGKLPSGTKAVVELAGKGDLNVARYSTN